MKVLSIKEPWASLIMNGTKKLKLEVGKLNIEEKFIFMLVYLKQKLLIPKYMNLLKI